MLSATNGHGYGSRDFSIIRGENEGSWNEVTRREPCPICGQGRWCSRSDDGAVTCMRAARDGLSTGGWRTLKTFNGAGGVGTILRRDDGLSSYAIPEGRPRRKKPDAPKLTPAEWAKRAAAYQMHLGDRRAALAETLGVDEAALARLHCGWIPDKAVWTLPERNAAGEIVGVSTRLAVPEVRDGKVTSKKMISGSRHGLFYDPEGWAAGEGPILLVEGASDTAAAYTMGLSAVGRPSNTGGVDLLAELLRDIPASRQIIVIGENDERDGKTPGQRISPGKNGAILTAKGLAERMGRAVAWAMPPAGAKDTRDYLRAAGRQAGPGFVELILAGSTTISPLDIEGVERMPDRGPARNLDEWREESRASKAAALLKPGFYLDRGGVGTGKTRSMIDAITATDQHSILWIMPDHANCKERETELRGAGKAAVAYPRLDENNCQNIEEVRASQAFGLVAGAAVCPGCRFKDRCRQEGYLALKQQADESSLRVSTISRAQASDSIFKAKTFKDDDGRTTGSRPAPSVIVCDERAGDVLAETIKTTMPDLKQAKRFLENIEARTPLVRGRNRVGRKEVAFAMGLIRVIDVIEKASEGVKKTAENAAKEADKNVAAGGVHRVELPPKIEMPKRWQAVFNEWVQTFKTLLSGERLGEDFAAGIRLITLAAAGDLRELWVMGERKIVTANGKRIATTQVEVLGKRMADIPKRAKVFLLDADATAEDLAARTGRKISDITPAGHIPFVQRVRQVPIDVTKGQSHQTTSRIIEAHLRAAPAVRRLGVIGHKAAVEEIFEPGSEHLKPWNRRRVEMWAGFGTGPDRGSNLWAAACDDLAVIGTPRAPTVRAWLVAHGEIEAAGLPDGDWGTISWEGVTIDGRRRIFEGKGFRHPAWRRASKAIQLAAIHQGAGRARAILPTGISVTVYTDQPTGFPVDESIGAALPSVHEAVDAVLWVMSQGGQDGGKPKAQNGLDTLLGDFALSPVRSPVVVERLMTAGERPIGRRAAQRKIDLAVDAGRLERLPGRLIGLALPSPQQEAPGVPSDAVSCVEVASESPAVSKPSGGLAVTAIIAAAAPPAPAAPPPPPRPAPRPTPRRLPRPGDWHERRAIVPDCAMNAAMIAAPPPIHSSWQ